MTFEQKSEWWEESIQEPAEVIKQERQGGREGERGREKEIYPDAIVCYLFSYSRIRRPINPFGYTFKTNLGSDQSSLLPFLLPFPNTLAFSINYSNSFPNCPLGCHLYQNGDLYHSLMYSLYLQQTGGYWLSVNDYWMNKWSLCFHQPEWSFNEVQGTSVLNKYPLMILYHTLTLKSEFKLTQSGPCLPQLISNHLSLCFLYSSHIGPLDVPWACFCSMATHGCSFCLEHSFPRSSPGWLLILLASA